MIEPPVGNGSGPSGRQDRLFDDDKDPQAFRTIGEVAAALGIKSHVLRYWEEQFASLEPVKRSGGRRYYRPADVELLQKINRLVNEEGYTIRGAAKALSAKAVPLAKPDAPTQTRVAPVSEMTRADTEILAQLRAIRKQLAAAIA